MLKWFDRLPEKTRASLIAIFAYVMILVIIAAFARTLQFVLFGAGILDPAASHLEDLVPPTR